MPSGRRPEGEHALSNAERQARYRARRQAEQPSPLLRYRRPTDRRSRAQRWREAVAELLSLQSEYAAWYEALPDSLHDTGECQASCRMACVMVFVYATPLFRVFDWLWSKAAWTTASRSGLSVTAAIGVQFRV
jgi:hypothetical protein